MSVPLLTRRGRTEAEEAAAIAAAIGSQQFEFVETFPSVGANAASITSGLIYLGRVRVAKPIAVTQMTYLVGTASGNVDLGIWTYVPATDTGTLVTSTGSTAAAGANALQSINLLAGYTLVPGVDYLFGFQADNATITFVRASNTLASAFKKRSTTISKTFGLAANAASITSLTAATSFPWIAAS